MPNPHVTRDSLCGFDRSKLRRHIEAHMGIKSNAHVFSSKGDSWNTTSAEQRQEQLRRNLLEKHLREAGKNENQFKQYLLERLADAGKLEPVKYDKQRLAQQRKRNRPARTAGKSSFVAVSQRVTRLANLERERKIGQQTSAVTSDKRKEYGHFVMEKV